MSEDDGQDMRAASLRRVRERQWVYLGPIAAAPLAHIAVSLYQATKSPQHKKIIMGVGVVGSTVGSHLPHAWHCLVCGCRSHRRELLCVLCMY